MDFGLLGRSLDHSFSRSYFTQKFHELKLPHTYRNFEVQSIKEWERIFTEYPKLKGLNITIPYKEAIVPYLHSITDEAAQIGAVNTIKIINGQYYGYNTDVYGFEESLVPLLSPLHKKALVLGSGGASRAVTYVLKKLNKEFYIISRNPDLLKGQLSYSEAEELLCDHLLLINTTPAGTYPNLTEKPPLSMELVGENHLIYDLIYNPDETLLLREAKKRGARVKNGREMLHLQAERSWEIWMEEETV